MKSVLGVYGAVGVLIALAATVAGLLLRHGDSLKGPAHPFPEQADPDVWKPFTPRTAPGEQVRQLWESASKLQIDYVQGGKDDTELLVRLRLAYQKIVDKHADTAYAAQAKRRLLALQDE